MALSSSEINTKAMEDIFQELGLSSRVTHTWVTPNVKIGIVAEINGRVCQGIGGSVNEAIKWVIQDYRDETR